MGIVKDLYLGMFAAIPTTANTNNVIKNPIDKSLENLIKNPTYQRIGNYQYIKFGDNDDMDIVLETLKQKSSTHSGIINRKSKMVAGDALTVGGKTGKKKAAWAVFEQSAGGKYGDTLEAEWKRIANIYETYGAVAILRVVEGGQIVMVKGLSSRQIRVGELNSDNEVDHFIVRSTFNRAAGRIFKGTERKVEVFDPEANQDESIIYVKNPATENDYYGIPNYIGAFHFIEADHKFGVTIHNAAENGFQPKVSATFIGRNMSEDQKDIHAAAFKRNFNAADGEIAIVNYVRREEEKPQIDKLDISNLDKTIDVMANLNDAKILTAHSVTNPSLFGVSVAGKLGNSGTELESAYNIFRAAETIPNRKLLLDALTLAFYKTNFEGVEFEVVDLDVSPQENRGDNVEPEEDKVEDKEKEDKEKE